MKACLLAPENIEVFVHFRMQYLVFVKKLIVWKF